MKKSGLNFVESAVLGIFVICTLLGLGVMGMCGVFSKSSAENETEAPNEETTAASAQAQETADTNESVLVMGFDAVSGCTDVIMLINLNTAENSVSILQIPRDTAFSYDGYSNKINSFVAHYRGENKKKDPGISAKDSLKNAAERFSGAIEQALCIPVDGYVTVDTEGFKSIIDIIGGVDMEVPFDMDYDDADQNLHIHLTKGKQHLDADKAEQFIRFRSGYVQGDFGRVNAQKIFLCALMEKLKGGLDILTLPRLAAEAQKYMTTNLSPLQTADLVAKAAKTAPEKMTMATLPGLDARTKVNSGAWYYVMNRKAALSLINEYFNTYEAGISDEEFDKSRAFSRDELQNFKEIYDSADIKAEIDTATGIENGELKIPLLK